MGSKECQGSRLYVVKSKIRVNTGWFLHCSRLKSTFSVFSGRIEKERAYPMTMTTILLLLSLPFPMVLQYIPVWPARA